MQRSTEEIPSKYRHIFEKFANFNRMQSEVIDKILKTDKSIVVSAPTGSGKTVILELAIIRLLTKIEDTDYKGEFKIIYIAPIKALCNEITADWKSKFDRLGVLCGSVTGDDIDFDLNTSKYSIIVTTPEKFDSLSRKWNLCDYMRAIKLLMIDEAVVSRMKTIRLKHNQQNDSTDRIRFIAVSATIPNIADLAAWLDDKDNTIYHKVSEDLRPVKLERHVLGYPYHNSTPFRFDMNLTYKLPAVIEKYSNNKPALIFCNSRRSAEMGATTIIDKVRLNLSDEQRQNIMVLSSKIEDVKLRKTISSGVGFHHAGLCVSDKRLIEEYFRSASLPILFSTNTLAMGVNLPAYLSVIKSTEMLIAGAVHELSEAVILQMIGRAGRPQFDDHGVAVIMTQSNKVKKYEGLITGTAPIESHLHNHLIEHLNSEIVSQTICNMELVTHWIRASYLYIRAIQKPFHYGFPTDAPIETVEQKLEELCVNAIDELEKYGLLTKTDSSLKATQLGRLMAHYYLNFETMKHFTKIVGTESIQEMLYTLITCPDFSSGYSLRVNDKRFLNELNQNSSDSDCIRFPIQGKVKTVTDKISCLMQAVLGNISINDSSITEEASQMVKLGQRIGRALQEYVALLDDKNSFSALVSIIYLLKSLHANLWENSPYVFKQFNKIGHVYSKVLSSNGKTTFESILKSTPSDIEMILKKRPPFGKDFLDAVLILPQFTITMTREENEKVGVVVKQVNSKFVCDSFSRGITLIVGDSTNGTLFINHRVQYFLIKYGTFDRTVSLKNSGATTVTAHLIHNGIVGLDKSATIILRPDELTEEMLEPEPEPVRATKRKSQDKTVRRVKQSKISDYLPKAAQKRKKTPKGNAKKAKTSQAECERQMELMENDGIIDLSKETNSNSPKILDTGEARNSKFRPAKASNNQMTNQTAVDFVRRFRFVLPSKPLNDIRSPSPHDNYTNMEDTVSEISDSDIVPQPVDTMPPPAVLLKHDRRIFAPSEPFIQSNSNGLNYSTDTRMNTKEDEDRSELNTTETVAQEDDAKSQNGYTPSCIKAMFGSQIVSQKKVQRPFEKNVQKNKDINFRYDHLLTPVDQVDLASSKSQSYSLCDVIEEQHKSHRTPVNKESAAFPFQNVYTKNFSAAKELDRIDQISQEVNDNDASWFSLEYESFPTKRSSYQFSVEPVPFIEPENKVARKEKTTPMALNERKYSKGNDFYKKAAQSTVTALRPLKPADIPAQSSQSTKNAMSTQQFYNYLDDVPMKSAGNNDRSTSIFTNSLINFDNPNNDWFESNRRSQRAPSAAMSQFGYASAFLPDGFIPSQSKFNWY